jgi:hypothetical protein
MEGFNLIALYDVDKSIVCWGYRIVVSKLDYYRQCDLYDV